MLLVDVDCEDPWVVGWEARKVKSISREVLVGYNVAGGVGKVLQDGSEVLRHVCGTVGIKFHVGAGIDVVEVLVSHEIARQCPCCIFAAKALARCINNQVEWTTYPKPFAVGVGAIAGMYCSLGRLARLIR